MNVFNKDPERDRDFEEMLITDVGELMSRRHCFANGRRVYHLAIIDYL